MRRPWPIGGLLHQKQTKGNIKLKNMIKETQMKVAYFIRGIIYCALCLLVHIQTAVAEKLITVYNEVFLVMFS